MTVAIVDYGIGNLHSVSKAIERLGHEPLVTGNPGEILAADRVILPGVGAFGDAMDHLRESGLDAVVKEVAATGRQPLLGICLGMQLLFTQSEEYGVHEGLDLLPGTVVRFEPREGYKVPHMAGTSCSTFSRRTRCSRGWKRAMSTLSIPTTPTSRRKAICWP